MTTEHIGTDPLESTLNSLDLYREEPAPPSFRHRRRINILFVIDQLCEAGGAELALLKTIDGLPKRQFASWLVTFKHAPEVEGLNKLPCPTYVLPIGRTYSFRAIRVARRIRNIIRSNAIDIVHTFHETSDIWGGLVAKASGCPILVSSRRDMGILRTKKHDVAYRVVNGLFDRVITVSDRVRKFCIEADGLNPKKVITLHNGIDVGTWDIKFDAAAYRHSIGLPATARIITTVGYIRKVKGIDVFIRAAADVCKQFPDAFFLVVGGITDKPHFEELVRLSKELGITERVRWLGKRNDIPSILKASDVLCLPSRSEGFSNALIEAMACGLPCVATDVGGNGEAITDGINGFVVQPEHPEAIATQVADLLRSPARAQQLGQAARTEVLSRFSLSSMIHKLSNIYTDLVFNHE